MSMILTYALIWIGIGLVAFVTNLKKQRFMLDVHGSPNIDRVVDYVIHFFMFMILGPIAAIIMIWEYFFD